MVNISQYAIDMIKFNLLDEHQKQYFTKWTNDFCFCVMFNSISVISGQSDVDNVSLCAIQPGLALKVENISAFRGLEVSTIRSANFFTRSLK